MWNIESRECISTDTLSNAELFRIKKSTFKHRGLKHCGALHKTKGARMDPNSTARNRDQYRIEGQRADSCAAGLAVLK